ncbi:PRELI-like family protein [Necator americanus]|uniref:PRELI-like family protein n=1 Tax=Necator americanus TaxID=51031 RepID=W2T4K2_NECAM|nr:PRELI-like family protein [Necator americanus]ETN76798.1 PRELI-like family protein [Necator americanus]
MRLWSAPTGLFPYSFDEVVSVFWDRYPNSFSKHIVSEDVLERKITENTIVTKKLIVKHGSSILKRVPRWLSRMTEIRTVPVIEESVYDRRTRTLTTYTRNVSHNELFAMHERCVYRPSLDSLNVPMTDLIRSVYIAINCGRMSGVYEKLMLLGFKKSVINTGKGVVERLEQRFGIRNLSALPKEKMKMIREKLSRTAFVHELKCEDK